MGCNFPSARLVYLYENSEIRGPQNYGPCAAARAALLWARPWLRVWFLAGSDEESEIADLFDFLLSHGPAGMFSSISEFSFVSWPAIRFLD
jgi:hypothetical protein